MSLNTMAQRMLLEIPGLASAYARTLLDEALGVICDSQMWSFQLKTSGWLTPGLLFPGGPGISTGTVTFIPYSNQIIGDAAASAAWNAHTGRPLLTELQIRSPYYSLYNIIAVSTTANPPFTTLTIDRPWMEPSGTGKVYMMYQAYFPVPVPDFKRFFTVVDTTNNSPMNFWKKTQKDLMFDDPQRTIFDLPEYVVPFEQDQRPNSATYGNMLYELWPHPLSVLPYTFNYLRRGPRLTAPADTVPYPLTEELLLWRAKEAGCLWKEAQKGADMERGMGADWKFLAQEASSQSRGVLKTIKDRDRDLVELYFSKFNPDFYNNGDPYATRNGLLNVGRF